MVLQVVVRSCSGDGDSVLVLQVIESCDGGSVSDVMLQLEGEVCDGDVFLISACASNFCGTKSSSMLLVWCNTLWKLSAPIDDSPMPLSSESNTAFIMFSTSNF